MADPQAATLTQLRNIQSKTGKTIAQLHALLSVSGLTKVGECRSLLMAQCQLGYGDANAVALLFGKPMPALDASAVPPATMAPVGDPLDAIYAGAKSHLRPLHAAVMAVIAGFGKFEEAPKKSYISLRRKKQFAMLGPATKDLIEIGLNAKDLPHHARLKVQPPGAMCQATTRIASVEDINADLTRWLKQAFDAAG
jgi:hypothetical protein